MSNQSVHTVTTSADKAKIGLAVCAVLAGVIGFYVLAGQTTLVRASALVGGLLLAVALAWTSHLGRSFIGFATESVRETKKSRLADTQGSDADHRRRVWFRSDYGDIFVGH